MLQCSTVAPLKVNSAQIPGRAEKEIGTLAHKGPRGFFRKAGPGDGCTVGTRQSSSLLKTFRFLWALEVKEEGTV